MPAHVACIMDGNGRWAEQRGLPRTEGHVAGEIALHAVIDSAIDLGINWLTPYIFSTENWDRPDDEVTFLMGFIGNIIDRNGPAFHARNIRIRSMGRKDERIPHAVSNSIMIFEDLTKSNTGLTLTFAFNYGGRAELVDAVNSLRTGDGPVSSEDLHRSIYFPDMPDPDLVIRFGGEKRLSNFMLWRIAYAELEFVDDLWPDVRHQHFEAAITRYRSRTRRFGTTPAKKSPVHFGSEWCP